MYALSQPQTATNETCAGLTREAQREPISQTLTLILDGITSDDYLQWVRDPDPPDRGDLKLISAQSDPLSDRIQLQVISDREIPAAPVAAHALGFPITTDVASVQATPERSTGRRWPCPNLIEAPTGKQPSTKGDARWDQQPTRRPGRSDRPGSSGTA